MHSKQTVSHHLAVKERRGQLPFADERQRVKSHDDEAELISGAFLHARRMIILEEKKKVDRQAGLTLDCTLVLDDGPLCDWTGARG